MYEYEDGTVTEPVKDSLTGKVSSFDKESLRGTLGDIEDDVPLFGYSEPVTAETKKVAPPSVPLERVGSSNANITITLIVSGLIVAATTASVGYLTLESRIVLLACVGTGFLMFALLSIVGSHLTVRSGRGFKVFRALNGVTVGAGLGFLIGVLITLLSTNWGL